MVLMGVAGSGKTLIGGLLAPRLGAKYVVGDTLHPATNIAKMSRGEPLTDADRWPWLDLVGATLALAEAPTIVGCSALKRAYRDRIRAAVGCPVRFVHLTGERALIAARMADRTGHFMPATLLDSQFAALEPPVPEEEAVSIDIDQPPGAVVSAILAGLRAHA